LASSRQYGNALLGVRHQEEEEEEDRKFSLDFVLNIGDLTSKTPYSSSEPNKSVIVNRQCVGGKFKYVPKFCIGGTGHVISRMPNDDLHRTGTLEANISKTIRDRGLVTMGD